MGIFSRFRKNEQKNNSESVSLSPKEKFKKMVPANPGIALNDDEVCLFMSDASMEQKSLSVRNRVIVYGLENVLRHS